MRAMAALWAAVSSLSERRVKQRLRMMLKSRLGNRRPQQQTRRRAEYPP